MIFFLYFLKNDLPYHRFAISVNKKIDNSVRRNFIKRKMREFFRLNQNMVAGKFDFWVVMKNGFDQTNCEEVEQLFKNALIKISYK
jgi:ribonuclease P protein component